MRTIIFAVSALLIVSFVVSGDHETLALSEEAQGSEGESMVLSESKELAVADNVVLTGSSWKVLGFKSGAQGMVKIIEDTTVTLRFGDDGRLTGSAGCNRYFTSYSIEGALISIGHAGATRMWCNEPEGIMDQEVGFLEALGLSANYEFEGDALNLFNSDGELLVVLQKLNGGD